MVLILDGRIGMVFLVASFKSNYAWRCGRDARFAFGALLHMREGEFEAAWQIVRPIHFIRRLSCVSDLHFHRSVQQRNRKPW